MSLLVLDDFDREYLKGCGLPLITSLELAMERMFWGTYGKERKHECRWVRLLDCSTEHLNNILRTQYQISASMRSVINAILSERNFGRYHPYARIPLRRLGRVRSHAVPSF